jgi:hypothetical protein
MLRPFMKRPLCLLLLTCCFSVLRGGDARAGEVSAPAPARTPLAAEDFEPPHLEFAAETAYLLSFIGNPNAN